MDMLISFAGGAVACALVLGWWLARRARRHAPEPIVIDEGPALREANADLQRKLNELMTEAFGEEASPARLTASRYAMKVQVQEAAAAYQRALGDAMGELDRMRKQLGL